MGVSKGSGVTRDQSSRTDLIVLTCLMIPSGYRRSGLVSPVWTPGLVFTRGYGERTAVGKREKRLGKRIRGWRTDRGSGRRRGYRGYDMALRLLASARARPGHGSEMQGRPFRCPVGWVGTGSSILHRGRDPQLALVLRLAHPRLAPCRITWPLGCSVTQRNYPCHWRGVTRQGYRGGT